VSGPQQHWRFSHLAQQILDLRREELRESEAKCLPTFPAPNYLIHTSCILFTSSRELTYSMLNRKLSELIKVHPSSRPDVWPRNVSCKALLTTERVLQRFESKFKLGTDDERSQLPGSFNSYSTWISVIVPLICRALRSASDRNNTPHKNSRDPTIALFCFIGCYFWYVTFRRNHKACAAVAQGCCTAPNNPSLHPQCPITNSSQFIARPSFVSTLQLSFGDPQTPPHSQNGTTNSTQACGQYDRVRNTF
jgi:hypothetical protein